MGGKYLKILIGNLVQQEVWIKEAPKSANALLKVFKLQFEPEDHELVELPIQVFIKPIFTKLLLYA